MMRLAAGIAAGALLLSAGAASAHALLLSANPAEGDTLESAPAVVSLNFSEALEPRFSGIEVTDAQDRRVDGGAAPGNARRMAVKLKPLAPGTYSVKWHATSVDTHRTEGSYRFTVK